MAIDHDGIIYGNTNTKEINFLAGKSDLVISQAMLPPTPTAITQATKAISTEFLSGI